MIKTLYRSVLFTFAFSSCHVSALEQPDLLIKLQKDIFIEMLRSHGDQIESSTTLEWCGHTELAEEIGLSTIRLKRAVFQSFIVAGTQNVQATEIARQMPDEEWKLFNNALFSDIKRYQEGLGKGFNISFPTNNKKLEFCNQVENDAINSARTLLKH
jgi:hypothetical protein